MARRTAHHLSKKREPRLTIDMLAPSSAAWSKLMLPPFASKAVMEHDPRARVTPA
jgi:hypothetical protein